VIRVLFVCMGNICRSPMAEAVFQHLVNEAGLSSKFSLDSAGTGGWHAGETAHRGTLKVLKEHNIPYDGRARQFVRTDLDKFDYVVAMDKENLSGINQYHGDRAEVRLFLDYAVEAGTVSLNEVPDPYYDGRFEQTYELVTLGCKALLDHIRAEQRS
jgi:protein-tyrosine phosphatase